METVILTALGVVGATLVGALIGFAFKKISHRFADFVLSFAAGVMLSAAVLGLILPSLEYGGTYGIVSMEDLLESIVGDIQDEYDDEEQELQEKKPKLI